MENGHTICVGTVGAGVWYSSDSGARWRRSRMKLPFYAEPGEIQIRSLVVSPHDPNVVYAGSEVGLYRSEDKGAVWDLIESPADGKQIWSIAVHPDDPNVILIGTKPPCVFRTKDGGQTWEELPLNAAESCLAGAPKVTNLLFDPRDSGTVWSSVEIDGIYRSVRWRRHLGASARPGQKRAEPGYPRSDHQPRPAPKNHRHHPGRHLDQHGRRPELGVARVPTFLRAGYFVLSRCGAESRRSQRHVCGQWGFHSGQGRGHPAFDRRWANLAGRPVTRRTQLNHVLVCHASGGPRLYRGQQPARLCLHQSGRRGVVELNPNESSVRSGR